MGAPQKASDLPWSVDITDLPNDAGQSVKILGANRSVVALMKGRRKMENAMLLIEAVNAGMSQGSLM